MDGVCLRHSEVCVGRTWDGKCEGLGVRGRNERDGDKTQRALINHVKEQNLTGESPNAMMEVLTKSWP